MTIGKRLKQARKYRHMTQDDLAKQIGTSRGVITNIELGKIKEPQLPVVNIICDVLDINKDWLLNGSGPMDRNDVDSNGFNVCVKKYVSCDEVIRSIERLDDNEKAFLVEVINSYVKYFKQDYISINYDSNFKMKKRTEFV